MGDSRPSLRKRLGQNGPRARPEGCRASSLMEGLLCSAYERVAGWRGLGVWDAVGRRMQQIAPFCAMLLSKYRILMKVGVSNPLPSTIPHSEGCAHALEGPL